MHANGLIHTTEPEQLPLEKIKAMDLGDPSWGYLGLYTFACNTRVRADRARKYLDYEPKAPSVFECMEQDLMACHRS
jgi:hypothetical protein